MSNATRTPQQAMADAIKSGAVQAFADGKKVQYSGLSTPSNWNDLAHDGPNFCGQSIIWRPAPTPRLRPWNPEEVPLLAQYRDCGWLKGVRATIVSAGVGAFSYVIDDEIRSTLYEGAIQYGTHSLDGGKTWHPCGVQEGGE